jgi:hypothetical protein
VVGISLRWILVRKTKYIVAYWHHSHTLEISVTVLHAERQTNRRSKKVKVSISIDKRSSRKLESIRSLDVPFFPGARSVKSATPEILKESASAHSDFI